MLVYGSREQRIDARDKLRAIHARIVEAEGLPGGLGRHSAIVTAFVEAAEYLQAVADAEAIDAGMDQLSTTESSAMALAIALARAVRDSWDSKFEVISLDGALELTSFDTQPDRGQLICRVAEGFAYYAVYP